MSKRAGQLLWNRMNVVLSNVAPTDVDTSIWQPDRAFEANSVGEPGMPEIGADPSLNPSRLQVIPQVPLDHWANISHGQPFAVLNLSGPNVGKTTMHVIFTNAGGAPVHVNVLFWDPDTKIGPGAADLYTAGAIQPPVNLGTIITADFRVLGATPNITSTGLTVVTGEIGVTPAASIVGFPPGTATSQHANDATAIAAKADLTAAYIELMARTGATPLGAADIGGLTITPGLYSAPAAVAITGAVTLDAGGNPNAQFIFQIGTAFNPANASSVVLAGGALAANIFWVVGSSAVLGTTAAIKGNILALTSITLNTGAALQGRALARNGTVTMAANAIGP